MLIVLIIYIYKIISCEILAHEKLRIENSFKRYWFTFTFFENGKALDMITLNFSKNSKNIL